MSGIGREVIQMARQAWAFIVYLWRRFFEDDCQSTAAALTYQTLFAVVPGLTVIYAILSIFKAFEGLSERVESFLFDNIIPENVSAVQQYLVSFAEQARNLGIPSVVLLVGTALLMLTTVEVAFNKIWRVKEPRHGFQRFLMYWAVLTLSVPFIGLSLAITGYIESLPFISDVTKNIGVLDYIPLLLTSSLFTLVYVVVPGCNVPIRHAISGGIIIALVFEIAKNLFVAIMSVSNFEAIYGTFAAIPLFLLWIYISWTIILLGAEFVKSLGVYRFGGSSEIEAPLVQLIIILELFYHAHQRGDLITDKDLGKLAHRIDLEQWPEIRSRLIQLNIIRVVERGGLVLSKDLNKVTLWGLHLAFPWQLPNEVKGDQDWERKLAERFAVLHEDNRLALKDDLESLFK